MAEWSSGDRTGPPDGGPGPGPNPHDPPYSSTSSAPWQQAYADGPLSTPPPVFGAPLDVPDPKGRKGLIIGLAAAAVVVVLVAVLAVVILTRSGGGASTPEAAVTGYLEALARGDAAGALAYGQSPPGSTDLLTDDILNRQITELPISDIRIIGSTGRTGYAQVHVAAKFGEQTSDTMVVVQESDGWKLKNAAVKLDGSMTGNVGSLMPAMQTVTVFGKPADQPLYVFPGWLDRGSTNPNLAVDGAPVLLQQLMAGTAMPVSPTDIKLSDAGHQAITTAISDALAQCSASNLLTPPGCPLRINTSLYVEGTAQWGTVDDISAVQIIPNPMRMTASIIGPVRMPLTAQTRGGAMVSNQMLGVLNGKVDLQSNPPTVTWN